MEVEGPLKVIVPVLPEKVPLFTQLPATVCEKLPPLKVVALPRLTLPLKTILDAAVYETEVPNPITLLKFPWMVKFAAGSVFTDAPEPLEKMRFP